MPDLSSLEAAISGMRGDFISKLEAYLDDLERIAEDLLANRFSDPAFDEAMNIAHRIAGVARTFGFEDLGQCAQSAEAKIMAFLTESHTPQASETAVLQICDLAEKIADICDQHL